MPAAQSLLAAVRRRAPVHAARPAPAGHDLRQGLLSNLANPKMAVFFTSLLPQFGDSFVVLLALGLLFCSLTLAWLSAYAFAVARAGDVLRRPRVRRTIDAHQQPPSEETATRSSIPKAAAAAPETAADADGETATTKPRKER